MSDARDQLATLMRKRARLEARLDEVTRRIVTLKLSLNVPLAGDQKWHEGDTWRWILLQKTSNFPTKTIIK